MLTVIGCDLCGEPALEVTVTERGEFRCVGCEAFVLLEVEEPELEPVAMAA